MNPHMKTIITVIKGSTYSEHEAAEIREALDQQTSYGSAMSQAWDKYDGGRAPVPSTFEALRSAFAARLQNLYYAGRVVDGFSDAGVRRGQRPSATEDALLHAMASEIDQLEKHCIQIAQRAAHVAEKRFADEMAERKKNIDMDIKFLGIGLTANQDQVKDLVKRLNTRFPTDGDWGAPT